MAKRSKLSKLMKWLTIADAAQHLTEVFDEEVTEATIFQLALMGRLTISVRFPNRVTAMQLTPGATYVATAEDSADYVGDEFPEDPFVVLPDGVYDLPMTGRERLDVEHEYQQRTEARR